MIKKVVFDVNTTYGCNFRCKYCYEQYIGPNYKPVIMSREVITRYAQYINYMRRKLKNVRFGMDFYGGEPLLYPNIIKLIIQRTSNVIDYFCIITNGSLILKNKDLILELTKYRTPIGFAVSYDFILQEENRDKGSYTSVREAIKWLYHQGLLGKVIATINVKNLPRIHDVFFDFLALKEECPDINCAYNIAFNENLDLFDKEGTIESLKKIQDFLRKNPQHYGSFVHNALWCSDFSKEDGGTPAFAVCGISPEGDLYPDYSMPYRCKELKDLTLYGNIFEDFSLLDTRRKEKLEMLRNTPLPDKCRMCDSTCKINSWNFLLKKTTPSDSVCYITKLLHSYMGEFR